MNISNDYKNPVVRPGDTNKGNNVKDETVKKVSKCSRILKKYFSDFKKEGICVFCSLISSTVSLVIYVGAEVVRNFHLTKELAWVMWGCLGVSAFFIALVALMLFIKVCRCFIGLISNGQGRSEEIVIKIEEEEKKTISGTNKKKLKELKQKIEALSKEKQGKLLKKYKKFIEAKEVKASIVKDLRTINNLEKFEQWKGFLGECFKDKISKCNEKYLEGKYRSFVVKICRFVLEKEGPIETIFYIKSFLKEKANNKQISCAKRVYLKIKFDIKKNLKKKIASLKNKKDKDKKLEKFKNVFKKDKVIWEEFELKDTIHDLFPREYIKNMEVKAFKDGKLIKDISRDIVLWQEKKRNDENDKYKELEKVLNKIEQLNNDVKKDILELMKKNKLPEAILKGWVEVLCNYIIKKNDKVINDDFINKIFEIVLTNKKVYANNIIDWVFYSSNIDDIFKKGFFEKFKEKIVKDLLKSSGGKTEALENFLNNYENEDFNNVLEPITKALENEKEEIEISNLMD